MKIAARLIPLVMLVAFAQGCANQTPAQTALDAHGTYNIVLSGLIDARHAGIITDAQKAQIEAVRAPVYQAIVAMDAAAMADNSAGFEAALKQYRAALPALRDWLLRVKPPAKTVQ